MVPRGQVAMTTFAKPKHQGTLLALDAGSNSTGWAFFGPDGSVITGAIGLPKRKRIDTRLSQLAGELDRLVEEWPLQSVIRTQPTGLK